MVNDIDREFVEWRRPSHVSWGSVIAGVALVIAIGWLMFQLGSAIGLSIVSSKVAAGSADLQGSAQTLGAGAAIWLFLTAIVAFFFGALLTGRLSAKPDRGIGILHGITVWGVATAFVMLVGIAGLGGAMQAGSNSMMGAGAMMNGSKNMGMNSPMMAAQTGMKSITAKAAEKSAGPEARDAIQKMDNATFEQFTSQLASGDDQGAKATLASNGLSDDQANNVVQGLARQSEQAAKAATDMSRAAMFAGFIASLLGLVFAVLGGRAGAERARRYYVDRGYEIERHAA